MAAYRYRFSLRLRHPTRDLASDAVGLGLTPTRVWRAGEPRTTPKGTVLDGLRYASYWTAPLTEGVSREIRLAKAIDGALDRLSPHRDLLLDIAADGGKAELFIGWFIHDGNSGDDFGWRLLARLADLRLDLGFDV